MTRLARPPRTVPAVPEQWGLPYEDFLKRYSGGEHVEWVEGEVVPMAAVTIDHARLQGFLAAVMKHVAESRDLGQVVQDPFQMKTGPELPGRAPDVTFVASKHLDRLHRLHLEGPADLVIEIVSPTSRTTDRIHKFREYETGGVIEYWVIDPELRQAEFYRLNNAGRYAEVRPVKGVVRSKTMKGFWVRTAWFWSPPLLLAALKELKVI